MIRYLHKTTLSLALAMIAFSGQALAGTMILDTFTDQAPNPVNLPATKVLMASVNTTADKGGNDATATAVTITGSVVAADVAEVCVDYDAVEIACVTSPGSLSNISISLPGNQKGGAAFDYRVSLNPSSAGKTIRLTVESITNTTLTDNIPLAPCCTTSTTQEVSISGSASVPTLSTPVLIGGLSTVTSSTATLGATQTGNGGADVTARGIVWNTTGSPTTADNTAELQTGASLADGDFSGLVGSPPPALTAGSLIYFRGYATNSAGDGYTASDGTVYTEPAAQPTGIGFSAITANSMTISWSDPGGATGAEGAIVVMKPGSDPDVGDEIPVDGNDVISYSPSNAWNSAGPIGAGGAKVVFLGSGNSVNVTELASNTFYFVRIYEYAGTGTGDTGINYLEESPLTGNDQTTSLPVPTLSTPVLIGGLSTVTSSTATLGATQTGNGGFDVTARGIVWNTTGSPTTADNTAELQTGASLADEAYSGLVGSPPPALTAGSLIYFRGYATNSAGDGYTPSDGTFYTEPAGQPTGISITNVSSGGMTVSWSDPGGATGAEGAIMVMKQGSDPTAGDEIPVDGNDASTYSPSNDWNSAGTIGAGGAKVMFIGNGNLVNVTGLIPETAYYVRIYEYAGTGPGDTGINYLEETPLTGNDTTTAASNEPTIQASGLIVDLVASTSMFIQWTAGNGDGSIVVIRPQGTSEATPVDGTDYAADADYSIAPETVASSDNFVVYKGTSTSLEVYGLTNNTTYTIAVYAYGGSGAGTDYLQANPATTDQIVDGLPMHNLDNGATCFNCHSNHGNTGLVPRQANQEAVCTTCHNSEGVASAKLDFSLHLTPNKAADDVDCGSCHELHKIRPGGSNTTQSTHPISTLTDNNLSFIRANVDKYVTTATTDDATYHTAGEDLAIEGGDGTTARGVCQSCHSDTSFHQHAGGSVASQCHQGGSNDTCSGDVTCTNCHEHLNNFAGSGGDCTACHNQTQGGTPPQDRREIVSEFSRPSSHIDPAQLIADDCQVCHAQEPTDNTHVHGPVEGSDKRVTLWNADDHNISYQLGVYSDPAVTYDTTESDNIDAHCLSCHDGDGADAEGGNRDSPFSGSNPPPNIAATFSSSSHGSIAQTANGTGEVSGCFDCHGSGHGSELKSLLKPAGTVISSPFSEEREGFCLNCHTTNGASSINIDAQFSVTPDTQVAGTNNTYQKVNKKHDVLPADQTYSGAVLTCKDCHDPHVANDANPVVNPDSRALLATYSRNNSYSGDATGFTYALSGADFDPTNPLGGTSIPEPDYVEFCLVCHDGVAPPGVTLPAGETMLNMADMYRLDDQHGRLAGSGNPQRGYMKQPWVDANDYANGIEPSEAYSALNCTLCHGPHGSDNIYNLRTSITVNGTVMTVGGKDVFTDPALCTQQCGNIINSLPEFGSTTYTLPAQEQFSWGAWCTFCHEPSHGTPDGTGCNTGHRHGGGNF